MESVPDRPRQDRPGAPVSRFENSVLSDQNVSNPRPTVSLRWGSDRRGRPTRGTPGRRRPVAERFESLPCKYSSVNTIDAHVIMSHDCDCSLRNVRSGRPLPRCRSTTFLTILSAFLPVPLRSSASRPRAKSEKIRPLFSYSCELLFPQLACFDIHANRRRGGGPLSQDRTLFALFALLCTRPRNNSCSFNRSRTLWKNHRGGGRGAL